jgi:hypothetical protein
MTGASMGIVAIGLVAVFMVAGMVGGGLLGQLHSASGQTAKGSFGGAAALAPAAPVNPSVIQINTTYGTIAPYNTLPFTVNFTIGVTNASINNVTTTVQVNMTDLSAHGKVLSTNPQTVTTDQTAYSFVVNSAALSCNNAACIGLPQDDFAINVYVNVNGTNHLTTYHPFFVITVPLQASLLAPAAGSAVSTGNVTVSVAYIGSYVAGVNLYIYNTAKTLVFSQNFIELTPGIPASANWFVGQTGTYSYTITINTVYTPNVHNFTGNITVTAKGGTVYQNSTTWTNQTVISGLSGAAAGTLLLVVGLIVGMIVALVLARAVMGRPAQAPPQPWESKPGAPSGPNTCSVCGRSFSTPDELAAHGKSEHGMQ